MGMQMLQLLMYTIVSFYAAVVSLNYKRHSRRVSAPDGVDVPPRTHSERGRGRTTGTIVADGDYLVYAGQELTECLYV